MSCVLGIDQSFAKTGCVIMIDGVAEHAFILPRCNGDHSRQREACLLGKSLKEKIEDWTFDAVAIEGIPFMSRSNVTRDLAGLQYIIYDVLNRQYDDDQIIIVPPSQLKKFATGDGKATKEDMIEAVDDPYLRSIMAQTPKTKGRDDLADAYHLAKYAANQLESLND